MKEELLKGLTEEQIAKVKACKNAEEVLSLARNEGVSLSDEQLEAVNGGGCGTSNKCPKCGSKDFERIVQYGHATADESYKCRHCGNRWQ